MILLDTQALLGVMGNSPRLGTAVCGLMSSQSESLSIGEASIWELGIKQERGGIVLPENFVDEVGASGFQLLPASVVLFWHSGQLPRHHGDPFDRLIIAQALQAGMAAVTVDTVFATYGVKVIVTNR